MVDYEYKTVALPATRRKPRRRELLEDAVALDLEVLLNEHGVDGWEFWCLETVMARPPKGMFRNVEPRAVPVMIFRRLREGVAVIGGSGSGGYSPPPAEPDPSAPRPPRLGGALE